MLYFYYKSLIANNLIKKLLLPSKICPLIGNLIKTAILSCETLDAGIPFSCLIPPLPRLDSQANN